MQAGTSQYRYRADRDPILPRALCATGDYDPDMWTSDDSAEQRVAQAICRRCPELTPCIRWGVSEHAPRFGILGGLTAKKRGNIRRQRRDQ